MNIQLTVFCCFCFSTLFSLGSFMLADAVFSIYYIKAKFFAAAKIGFLMAGFLAIFLLLLIQLNMGGYRIGENWVREAGFIFIFIFIYPGLSFYSQEKEWQCLEKE